MLTFSVAFLSVAVFPARVYVQDISVKDTNAIIELFNNCTCLPQEQCGDNDDYSAFIQRRMGNTNTISCQSESSLIHLYCCKQPRLVTTTTTTKSVVKNPDTQNAQNAILEVFHQCKCVPEDQCEVSTSTTETNDPSTIIQRRVNQNAVRIRCQSESSTNLYCCKQPDNNSAGENLEKNKDMKCGTGLWPLTPRILAGREDEPPADGEFPWMAAIFRKGNRQMHCGGSLIHPKVVLTASHCVHKRRPGDLKVAANGKVQLPSKEEEQRDVIEIIKHPRYVHFGRLYNDAALLILDRPFPTTGDNRINTLCLPPSDIDLEDANCYVAGWGKDANGQSERDMKKTLVPFVGSDQCQTFLRRTSLGKNFILHESFMCAGGEKGKDACVGDGGGPLMCEMASEVERYFQAGIVSWGMGCGDEDVPGVYTDVEKVSAWIRSQLAQRNLDI